MIDGVIVKEYESLVYDVLFYSLSLDTVSRDHQRNEIVSSYNLMPNCSSERHIPDNHY